MLFTVKNYYSEFDGIHYLKGTIMINYNENIYLNQYRERQTCCKEFFGEHLLSPFITYDKIKTYYPIKIVDLRFKVDYETPKKIRLFEENDEIPTNTNSHVI